MNGRKIAPEPKQPSLGAADFAPEVIMWSFEFGHTSGTRVTHKIDTLSQNTMKFKSNELRNVWRISITRLDH